MSTEDNYSTGTDASRIEQRVATHQDANPAQVPPSKLTNELPPDDKFRILSLDGGGAKGFYTLGVLKEIEAMLESPISKRFDLIYGTSTGAIIAALLALGYEVDEIHKLYKKHVPSVMKAWTPIGKSRALGKLAKEVFGDKKFDDVKTRVGIVATRWESEKPMIFKSEVFQAHGRVATFSPGFGCTIADAVQASCSAVPFFLRKYVITDQGNRVKLMDGGFCANNPTLYAIADAVVALQHPSELIRVVSLGVGVYPARRRWSSWPLRVLPAVILLQKVLEVNTQSMDQLRVILYKHIPTVRISDTYERPEMATDLTEHNLRKLNLLYQKGGESFASREQLLREYLL